MTLTELNSLSPEDARAEFAKCCGSQRWAEEMSRRRPFETLESLLAAADEIWWELDANDWKEAFSHHPRIGDLESLRGKFAGTAASAEQEGVITADESILRQLAEGNRLYEEKFGHTFIVFATGKRADEMLRLLRQRLDNHPAQELLTAAAEQAKITKLRLQQLLTTPTDDTVETAEDLSSVARKMTEEEWQEIFGSDVVIFTLPRPPSVPPERQRGEPPLSLSHDTVAGVNTRLSIANREFARNFPGDSPERQPVHTVYGGAQIFKADTAGKLGALALASLKEYAPTPSAFARALGLDGTAEFRKTIYDRVVAKLKSEPVEDFRIDFEDGYGNRPDAEEDQHVVFCAGEVARGMRAGSLPPFIGFRIKPLTEDLKARAIRTLDLFISTLVQHTGGALPNGFVVTLPKVVMPAQVSALATLLSELEQRLKLPARALKLELMIETPQSIFDPDGKVALPSLIAAADGRCVAAHFGVYDYTASNNITALYQTMDHPACDFARTVMKVVLSGTGIWLSDGATNIMPVGPHRPQKGTALTARQKKENREAVYQAWRLGFTHINHSLKNGYYQGWDLHPAQLPVRYAAVYAFFLRGLDAASVRLRTFIEKAAQATLIGEVFDDAATGQGLLNFFLRGLACKAITEEEARATGLTIDELRTRSFLKILLARKTRQR